MKADRRKIRRVPPVDEHGRFLGNPPHGTYARLIKHRKTDRKPCDACKAAGRDYMLRLRKTYSTDCTPGLGWPLRERADNKTLCQAEGTNQDD
jgi:hypothetical protein